MSERGRNKRRGAAVKHRLRSRSRPLLSPNGGRIPVSPVKPVVSVIIPVLNERRTIAAVIRQAKRVHPATEVIVVANGTRDGSDELARRAGARVISYPEPLGHDVGRSVGAMHAEGDVLLFIDGDMILRTWEMRPFVWAVLRGLDLALNAYSGPTEVSSPHSVVLSKFALNHILGRPDLRGASLTAVPHAISRRAIASIGVNRLMVPPIAQAAAIRDGLRVMAIHTVLVGKRNPLRRRRRAGKDPLEDLILGDHLEAIGCLLEQTDPRGLYHDNGRNRSAMGWDE